MSPTGFPPNKSVPNYVQKFGNTGNSVKDGEKDQQLLCHKWSIRYVFNRLSIIFCVQYSLSFLFTWDKKLHLKVGSVDKLKSLTVDARFFVVTVEESNVSVESKKRYDSVMMKQCMKAGHRSWLMYEFLENSHKKGLTNEDWKWS